jgi:hypothetical protein
MTVLKRPMPIHSRWLLGIGCLAAASAEACTPTPCTCVCQIPCSPEAVSKPAAARHGEAHTLEGATSNAKIVWDGDSVGQGAKGWADCERKPKCSSSLIPDAGNGKDSPTALAWHGEGAGWVGAGWNLFGWWPKDAGLDITDYKTLRMDVRIAAKVGANAAGRRSFSVVLKCSASKECQSDSADLAEFAKGELLDGKWHQVMVPLSKLTSKAGFDSSKFWELNFNTWSESAAGFSVYVDNIAFAD